MAFLLTVGPISGIVFILFRGVSPRFLRTAAVSATVLFAALFAAHHQNLVTGLDVQCYRALARGFAEGRGFFETDAALASVPRDLRPVFLFRSSRPARDMVRRISPGDGSCRTELLFEPMLPLAASALGRLTPVRPGELRETYGEDAFMPLLGALWFLVLIGFLRRTQPKNVSAGKLFAILVFPVFLATPLPVWFLRGFHSDVAGATLVSIALCGFLAADSFAADTSRRGTRARRALSALSAFLCGLSLAYHFTMALPVLGVLLAEVIRHGKVRHTLTVAISFLAGLLPIAAITAFVCCPYFNIRNPGSLRLLAERFPEVRILLSILIAGSAAGMLLTVLAHVPSVRLRFSSPVWIRSGKFLCILILLGACLLPVIAPRVSALASLARGFSSVGGSPACQTFVLLLGVICLAPAFAGPSRIYPGPVFLRAFPFLTIALTVVSLFFLTLKGIEVPAGMWSFRRLFPIVALWAPVLTTCFVSALTNDKWGRPGRRFDKIALPIANGVVFVLFTLFILALNVVTERGSARLLAPIEQAVAETDLCVFDYHPHAIPFMRDPTRRVLGLPERQSGKWPAVSAWLAREAATNDVAVATSYEPVLLEESYFLRPLASAEGRLSTRSNRKLYEIRRTARGFRLTLCGAHPFKASERPPAQHKVFDGGPIGLRGNWTPAHRGGQIPGDGASIVVPAPGADEVLHVRFLASFYSEDGTRFHGELGLPGAECVSFDLPPDPNPKPDSTGLAIELDLPPAAEIQTPTVLLPLPGGISFREFSAEIRSERPAAP